MSVIHVKIDQFDYESATSFWIYRRTPGYFDVLDLTKQPAQWHRYPMEDATMSDHTIAPSFKICGQDDVCAIKQALANALAKSGFVSDTHEGIRGRLEVTEGWLKDMRTLVFKDLSNA